MQRLLAWLRLLRLPNVLTVPGDVLAGAVLAGRDLHEVGLTLPGVSLAYLFGMVLNDVWDVNLDRIERPERPLPSGEISRRQAAVACGVLGIGALAVQPNSAMVFLLGLIVAYTLLKGRTPVFGRVLMGLCRGTALWLGAGAPWLMSFPLGIGIVLWVMFISMVTHIASFETGKRLESGLPWVLPMILNIGFLGMAYTVPSPSPWAYLPGLAAFILVNLYARDIVRAQAVRPSDIGRLLGLLFLMQAFVLALHGQVVLAASVWLLAPLMRLARRYIPAS
ncbi:MAG: UbiA family prenyltransferase [Verrucomicrobia bacterium]|nr:UbiA family prenyltransferase [Verrucomicrobiota bacterium]MCH8528518.1 UbiA family prenyltransferase [Kiritimatiellia bacterium]